MRKGGLELPPIGTADQYYVLPAAPCQPGQGKRCGGNPGHGTKAEYEQIIKDPYVLEFLDRPANERFYRSNLEQALIDYLQKFLLELGRGFSFIF